MNLYTVEACVKPVVTVRIVGNNAIVPSASGPHCYSVNIRCRVPVSCDCPARRKFAAVPCKHMVAVREALVITAKTGLDTARVELVPQTRSAKPAPTLRDLYSTKPTPTFTDAQKNHLAAYFAKREAEIFQAA